MGREENEEEEEEEEDHEVGWFRVPTADQRSMSFGEVWSSRRRADICFSFVKINRFMLSLRSSTVGAVLYHTKGGKSREIHLAAFVHEGRVHVRPIVINNSRDGFKYMLVSSAAACEKRKEIHTW